MKCLYLLTLASVSIAELSYDCGTAPCLDAAKMFKDLCGDLGPLHQKCACGMSDGYFNLLYECSKECKGLQIEGYTGPNDYKKAYCTQASVTVAKRQASFGNATVGEVMVGGGSTASVSLFSVIAFLLIYG